MNNFDLRKVKWGDIFICDLERTNGSVEYGVRPVVVIQTNRLNYSCPTATVAVITSAIKMTEMKTHIVLGKNYGLKKESMIMLEQTTTIEKSDKLLSYVGRITDEDTILKIKEGLRYQFDLMRKPRPRRTGMILCLCPKCRGEFFDIPENIVRRVDPLQSVKEPCDKCQVGYGYDYLIMKKTPRQAENGGL